MFRRDTVSIFEYCRLRRFHARARDFGVNQALGRFADIIPIDTGQRERVQAILGQLLDLFRIRQTISDYIVETTKQSRVKRLLVICRR